MRPLCSWLLLLLISLQWIGGHLCFKVMHSAVVISRMNTAEEAVAQAMKAETGVNGHIHILGEDQLELTHRIGYSNVFIFNKQIGEDTIYFTVEPAPLEKIEFETTDNQNSRPDKNRSTFLLKKLFSGFVINEGDILVNGKLPAMPEANFVVAHLIDLFNPSIPLPPPKQA